MNVERLPKIPPPSRGPEPASGVPLHPQPTRSPELGAAEQVGAARLPLASTTPPPPDARFGFTLPSAAADSGQATSGPVEPPVRKGDARELDATSDISPISSTDATRPAQVLAARSPRRREVREDIHPTAIKTKIAEAVKAIVPDELLDDPEGMPTERIKLAKSLGSLRDIRDVAAYSDRTHPSRLYVVHATLRTEPGVKGTTVLLQPIPEAGKPTPLSINLGPIGRTDPRSVEGKEVIAAVRIVSPVGKETEGDPITGNVRFALPRGELYPDVTVPLQGAIEGRREINATLQALANPRSSRLPGSPDVAQAEPANAQRERISFLAQRRDLLPQDREAVIAAVREWPSEGMAQWAQSLVGVLASNESLGNTNRAEALLRLLPPELIPVRGATQDFIDIQSAIVAENTIRALRSETAIPEVGNLSKEALPEAMSQLARTGQPPVEPIIRILVNTFGEGAQIRFLGDLATAHMGYFSQTFGQGILDSQRIYNNALVHLAQIDNSSATDMLLDLSDLSMANYQQGTFFADQLTQTIGALHASMTRQLQYSMRDNNTVERYQSQLTGLRQALAGDDKNPERVASAIVQLRELDALVAEQRRRR